MGIPDTYTMPIPDYGTFTFEERSSAQDTQDQEQMASCTQLFRRSILYKKPKLQLKQWPLCFSENYSSHIFTRKWLMKAVNNITVFTPKEIKKATSNYSIPIGRGGSGSVYKGILPNNQVIAVKRLGHNKDQFFNEIIALSQINSRNVVKLLGCCFETKTPSIIYEYIPNGTLNDHLFDEQKSSLLNWNRRLRIASQVAQVLVYLHNTIRVSMIHRDIKPSNILLGDNYIAKVSDFGISTLIEHQDEFYMMDGEECVDIWESHGLSTNVRGTWGYVDPEYIFSGRVSKKSDVYSFGVVLAQLLTGQKPFSFESEGEKALVCRFLKRLKDDCLVEILDELLVNEGRMDQLIKVAHLAKWCLELKPDDRPTATQVVRELQGIRRF